MKFPLQFNQSALLPHPRLLTNPLRNNKFYSNLYHREQGSVKKQRYSVPAAAYGANQMKIRTHVLVEGRVQGVFFRAETRCIAQQHNLTGWVRNLPDGRVEAVFEGEEDDVEKAVQWCHKGPPSAMVTKVAVKKEPCTGEFETFSIS
jgi:acylphosphatase